MPTRGPSPARTSPLPLQTPSESPPPPRLTGTERTAIEHAVEVEAFSRTVTAQFRSFAQVERRRRKLRGGLQIGAGALLLGIGTANFFIKRGTTAQGSGLGILGTGAVSVAGGIYGVVVPGPAETFVNSELFEHGSQDGWTVEMLDAITRETRAKARQARRRRRVLGGLLVGGGSAAAVTITTLLGLELAKSEPDGVIASSYAQGIGTSVGVIVSGIVSLAAPTIIEVLADNIRARRGAAGR